MDTLRQDLRYSFRNLLRSPGFTAAALLTLALGIGANTAIFTLANAVFLHPLPIQEPSRVLEMYTVDRATQNTNAYLVRTPISYLNYLDFREQTKSLTGLGTYFQYKVTVSGQGIPKAQPVEIVSANYFDTLGVKAALGRTFEASEDRQAGGNPVTVISHSLWTHMFGADPNVLGRTVNFNAQPYTIVGVTPAGFKGLQTMASADVAWIPVSMHAQVLSGQFEKFFNERRARLMYVFGRLKPGVESDQALTELRTIASRLEQEYPKANKGRSIDISNVSENALGFLPRQQMVVASFALVAVVALLLLIASANLANLLLARSARRLREMSIRTALGAERGRLMRQLMTENMVLFLLGGALGLIVGSFGVQLLWSFRPADIAPDGLNLSLDLRVLAFTAGATLLTGILFGLVPAVRGSSANVAEVLKAGGRTGSLAITRGRLRAALVAGELALAMVGLTCAGLFIRSMQQADTINPGFDTKNLLVFSIDTASRGFTPERGQAFFKSLMQDVQQVPGVESVALAMNAPVGGGIARTVVQEGQPADAHGSMSMVNVITPGYFTTMKIPLKQGRMFTEFDRSTTTQVAVISEVAAKHFWPNEDPIGKRFRFIPETSMRQVVGVVGDTDTADLGEQKQPVAYLPLEQEFTSAVTVHVRTTTNPENMLRPVLARAQALDENLALTNPATIRQVIDQNLWGPRAGAALFGVFGLLGLVLASVGVYGVMANMVTQRTGEIGIRMALGAQVTDVVNMVLSHSMKLAVLGIGIGLAAALGVTGMMSTLLFGIGPRDPLTYILVGGVLLFVAMLAGAIPALRAARIDPLVALRED